MEDGPKLIVESNSEDDIKFEMNFGSHAIAMHKFIQQKDVFKGYINNIKELNNERDKIHLKADDIRTLMTKFIDKNHIVDPNDMIKINDLYESVIQEKQGKGESLNETVVQKIDEFEARKKEVIEQTFEALIDIHEKAYEREMFICNLKSSKSILQGVIKEMSKYCDAYKKIDIHEEMDSGNSEGSFVSDISGDEPKINEIMLNMESIEENSETVDIPLVESITDITNILDDLSIALARKELN